MNEKQIVLRTDDGEYPMYVIEQTRLNGVDYLLVSDSEADEADCWIFKDVSKDSDPEAVYEEVTDPDEAAALQTIFESLLEDTVFETGED
ncbi:MAG: DUF1292 domain-containing protein [Lachnospiraceae bacterium]|nr:DUF1292 domain-containing protein [Lachnospiraceae bacterium]